MNPIDNSDFALLVYCDWLADHERYTEEQEIRENITNPENNNWNYEYRFVVGVGGVVVGVGGVVDVGGSVGGFVDGGGDGVGGGVSGGVGGGGDGVGGGVSGGSVGGG